jgi:hypothetical protein
MGRWVLIAATVVDVGLAILLVAVSGFIVGSRPESMDAGRWSGSALAVAISVCLAAPIGGFVMRAYRRPTGGILLAWLPVLLALFSFLVPAPS